MNTDCRTMKSAMLQKNDVYSEDLFSPRDHLAFISVNIKYS